MPRWLPGALARIHRLAAQGKVQVTAKAAEELKASALGLDVFKPWILGTALYVKLVLRADCVVVSFHKEQANEDEDNEDED